MQLKPSPATMLFGFHLELALVTIFLFLFNLSLSPLHLHDLTYISYKLHTYTCTINRARQPSEGGRQMI
jgi:hypothetical protein